MPVHTSRNHGKHELAYHDSLILAQNHSESETLFNSFHIIISNGFKLIANRQRTSIATITFPKNLVFNKYKLERRPFSLWLTLRKQLIQDQRTLTHC